MPPCKKYNVVAFARFGSMQRCSLHWSHVQVGQMLLDRFDGQAARLVERAERSAARLVDLVASSFAGFRDHAIYRGQQVLNMNTGFLKFAA